MQVKTLLEDYIRDHDLCPGSLTLEQWSSKTWLESRVGDRVVRVFPMWLIRDVLAKHDVHHVLTGYATDVRGEAQVAAWELASGGCYLNVIFWVDRILFTLFGLLAYPRSTVRAIRRGVRCRNLFAMPMSSVLAWDVAALKVHLGLRE